MSRQEIALETIRILVESMQVADKAKDARAFFTLVALLELEVTYLERRK